MNITKLNIDGLLLIEPEIYNDNRGLFFESFNNRKFEQAVGYPVNFVQDNHSKSIKNVFRGLHYQLPPKAQGKLVRVIAGEVIDFAVDIRENSITFGQFVSVILSAENAKQLWIPPGFAHGFLTVSDYAEFVYKVTEYYDPVFDRSIVYNDPDINLNIHNNVIVSEKDLFGKSFKQTEYFKVN
jgi:dTDP-4-dehydrorhamnose 3,5-epimerase